MLCLLHKTVRPLYWEPGLSKLLLAPAFYCAPREEQGIMLHNEALTPNLVNVFLKALEVSAMSQPCKCIKVELQLHTQAAAAAAHPTDSSSVSVKLCCCACGLADQQDTPDDAKVHVLPHSSPP